MDSSQNPVAAAVLVPVYRGTDGRLHLVLVLRSAWGVHGGQLGFPGGKVEPGDRSLREAALREAWEEIGLEIAAAEILADLPPVDVQVSGYRIHPFLARVVPSSEWRRSEREIDDVIAVPIETLLDPATHAEELMHRPVWPEPRMIPFYRISEHRLWGATYRIVRSLLPRLEKEEFEI